MSAVKIVELTLCVFMHSVSDGASRRQKWSTNGFARHAKRGSGVFSLLMSWTLTMYGRRRTRPTRTPRHTRREIRQGVTRHKSFLLGMHTPLFFLDAVSGVQDNMIGRSAAQQMTTIGSGMLAFSTLATKANALTGQ